MILIDCLVPMICVLVLALPFGFMLGVWACESLEKDRRIEKQGERE